MTRNVFVVGMNKLNAERLKRLRGVEDVEFHPLLTPEAVSETQDFDIPAMLAEAEATLDAFDGSIDAIVGYIDFPVSTMLPILCKKYGTPQASLESLLKCEHKYWSRKVMAEIVPDNTPTFTAFDPFDDNALSKIGEADLRFPFFVKPIKSSGSRLGFRIDSPEDFDYAIAALRAEIGQISEPFNYVLDQADLPDDIKAIEGHYCMAERVIGGRQCTVGLCAQWGGGALRHRRFDPLPAGAQLFLLPLPLDPAAPDPGPDERDHPQGHDAYRL